MYRYCRLSNTSLIRWRSYSTMVDALKSSTKHDEHHTIKSPVYATQPPPQSQQQQNLLKRSQSNHIISTTFDKSNKLQSINRLRRLPRHQMTPNVWAYATAESYDFNVLQSFCIQPSSPFKSINVYCTELMTKVVRLVPNNQHPPHFQPAGELLLFSDGVVVMWDLVDEESRQKALKFINRSSCEIGRYDENLALNEAENLTYLLDDQIDQSQFRQNEILHVKSFKNYSQQNHRCENIDEVAFIDRFAVSDAMAKSVKLSIREEALSNFADTLDPILNDLKQGRIRLSKHDLLKKTGHVFSLRHDINIDSNLLDHLPDFYWDRDECQRLYSQANRILCTAQRLRVMNEKLNYCLQLGERLDSHLNATHSVRLERIIIFLIAIEVAFELIAYLPPLFG